jgi:FkbM family methyltransferase
MLLKSQFFETTAFGYAFLKEIRKYYRGLKLTGGFHRVIFQMLSPKGDRTVTLRDGTSIKLDKDDRELSLFWGLVNIKHMGGMFSMDNHRIRLTLPRHQLRLLLPSPDDAFIVGEVLADEVYRPLVNSTLKNRVVVDIGSFIGITPIYFALRGATVVAYEVLPLHYEFSLLNIEANGLTSRVAIHNSGFGGVRRTIAVPLDYSDYRYSVYSSTPNTSRSKYVDIITLPDIMERNHIDKIHLLKLDCEGCEYEFFESVDAETLGRVKEIVLEFHESPEPILDKLRKSGFCAIKLRKTIRAFNMNFPED